MKRFLPTMLVLTPPTVRRGAVVLVLGLLGVLMVANMPCSLLPGGPKLPIIIGPKTPAPTPTPQTLDMDEVMVACDGVIKSPEEAASDFQATTAKVDAILADLPLPPEDPESLTEEEIQGLEEAAGAAGGELITLSETDPMIVGAAGQKQECVEVRNKEGELVDVARITTSAGYDPGGEGASGEGLSYWRCTITKTWDSMLFGSKVATMILQKDWGYVKDPNHDWFAFIGYNPPPMKINEHPFSSIDDSPAPEYWWYYLPFMVESNAKTKFKQQLIFTVFSHWLESYLIVGPEGTCVGW